MPLEISQANAVSRSYFDKTLINIAYDSSPFFKKLKSKNKIIVKGGIDIHWPIRYKAMSGNGAVAAVDPAAPVTYGVGDSRTAAHSAWKYYFGSTKIDWKERVENVGDAQIVSLIKDKFVELSEDYEEKQAVDLFATAAYDEAVDLAITPLSHMVSASKYAGIAAADAPRWKSGVYAAADWPVLELYATDALKGKKALFDAITAATFGGKKPRFMLTTSTILAQLKEKIWLATKFEGTSDKDTLDMGFTNLTFEGAVILADPYCPAGYFYGLDMDAFEYQVHPDFNFLVKDWEALELYPNNMVKKMSFAGNTKMNYRHTSFVFNGVTGIEKV